MKMLKKSLFAAFVVSASLLGSAQGPRKVASSSPLAYVEVETTKLSHFNRQSVARHFKFIQ